MERSTITFDQLSHEVSGLIEKLDRVLELLEKVGAANPFKQHKPSQRIVHAKEACTIIGKSLSTLYRAIKAPNAPFRATGSASPSTFMRMSYTHELRISANTPLFHPLKSTLTV